MLVLLNKFFFVLKLTTFVFLDETYNLETGDKLTTNQMSAYVVGAGGFGGPRNSKHSVACIDPPKRNPCASFTQKTSPDQVRKLINILILEYFEDLSRLSKKIFLRLRCTD